MMLSDGTEFDDAGHSQGSPLDHSYMSTQEGGQINAYREYIYDDNEPKEHLHNVNNLFDDSDTKDRKWLQIARMYLARHL